MESLWGWIDMTKSSRDLEILIAKIQKQLAPNAEVLHYVKLDGRLSKQSRQIDVLVHQKNRPIWNPNNNWLQRPCCLTSAESGTIEVKD